MGVISLLAQVPFKLSPHQGTGSLNLCGLSWLLTVHLGTLSYSVIIKSHHELASFFFPFLVWWKQSKKTWGWRREERQSELLNGDTQSEYLIFWFYWIKGEKVVLVCCLPVKPWQASILFPDWSFLLPYRIQSVIMAYIWAVLHTQLKFSGWNIYLWPGELFTQFPWRNFVAVSLVAWPFLKMDCPGAAPASNPRVWHFM